MWVVSGGSVTQESFDPAALGVARASLDDLRGGDAAHNARVAHDLLAGAQGPVRDATLLNAAAALAAHAADDAPLLERLADGLTRASAALDSGDAAAALERWTRVSQDLRG